MWRGAEGWRGLGLTLIPRLSLILRAREMDAVNGVKEVNRAKEVIARLLERRVAERHDALAREPPAGGGCVWVLGGGRVCVCRGGGGVCVGV